MRAANLQPGEVVIDLGSGAGLDCFLAGVQVGRRGKAVGVDMTPEMLSTARRIAKENRIRNVEFRLGEIENLPAADNFADVCISNCVINMSLNKGRVYREIYRVLKPGGRISICDRYASTRSRCSGLSNLPFISSSSVGSSGRPVSRCPTEGASSSS